MYIHTIYPTHIPEGYFCHENVSFIQNKIAEVLRREYAQKVIVDVASIKRIMQRVLEERTESIPKMNQRTIMYITNEFRNHQDEIDKKLRWEETRRFAYTYHDPTACNFRADLQNIKLSNWYGKPRVGGTTRFYFT